MKCTRQHHAQKSTTIQERTSGSWLRLATGKGRHQVWKHPLLIEPIVIARKDGDDVPDYLERKLKIALALLKKQGDS